MKIKILPTAEEIERITRSSMTETVRRHFQEYLDENKGICSRIGTAQHFYDFALEDIRKEIESEVEELERMRIESTFRDGEYRMAKYILSRIDELKK